MVVNYQVHLCPPGPYPLDITLRADGAEFGLPCVAQLVGRKRLERGVTTCPNSKMHPKMVDSAWLYVGIFLNPHSSDSKIAGVWIMCILHNSGRFATTTARTGVLALEFQ